MPPGDRESADFASTFNDAAIHDSAPNDYWQLGRFEHPIAWLALLTILVLVAAVRWRYADMPLERDEGEFAYGGQVVLAGKMPYQSFYAMKLPGIYFDFALIEATLGQSSRAIHLGLLVVNLASIVLVYLLGARLFDATTGWLTAAAFALLTLSPSVAGTQAQAEHFVLLPALAGACLLAGGRFSVWTCFLAGVAFGLAMLTKQHGFVFPLFGIVLVASSNLAAWRRYPSRRVAEVLSMLFGISLPIAVVVALLIAQGAWEPFLTWTIRYPREYVREMPLWQGMENLRSTLRAQAPMTGSLWIAAVVGMILVVAVPYFRRRLGFVALWTAAGCLAVTPGLWFRVHYFVLLAPAIALLAAVPVRAAFQGGASRGTKGVAVSTASFLLVLGISTLSIATFMLPKGPDELLRAMFDGFYIESPEIAEYLAKHTEPDQNFAVLGSEPQLFFYARRGSATGHIYMYPLMENQPYSLEFQRQAIAEIEQAKPPYIVFCLDALSWCRHEGVEDEIWTWLHDYLRAHYHPVARYERQAFQPAVGEWDAAQLNQPSTAPNQLFVMRRNAGNE